MQLPQSVKTGQGKPRRNAQVSDLSDVSTLATHIRTSNDLEFALSWSKASTIHFLVLTPTFRLTSDHFYVVGDEADFFLDF